MSEANVIIQVQDINDNSPIFTHKDYKIAILESVAPSKIILNVKATDKDSSNTEQEKKRGYGEVRYALTGENANMFEIDTINGNIQVNFIISHPSGINVTLCYASKFSFKKLLSSE